MFAYEVCARQREFVRASAFADGCPECGELVGVGRAICGLESRYEFESAHCSMPRLGIVKAASVLNVV
ncbi:hypothetical protein CWO89_44455 [Bradyrhizobium sp. Leo170]|nr:hypothetical protein CWO89_44455 [Bradyrhizobium sp. Leo170]